MLIQPTAPRCFVSVVNQAHSLKVWSKAQAADRCIDGSAKRLDSK
jgi:hypothetical protein